MAKKKAKERNPLSLYYRVSVLDEAQNRWIVKHAGMTKAQAESAVAEYFDNGIMARMSAC